MQPTPRKGSLPRWATVGLLVATALLPASCDKIADALGKVAKDGVHAPTSGLNRVDLVQAPTLDQMLGWSCFEYAGETACSLVGVNKPAKSKMLFSFDIVFDMFNPNSAFPIPLVELLLAINVYDDNSLGVMCVSFCDPDADGDCDPTATAEDACTGDGDTQDINGIEDLVPTVPDLIELAEDVATGDFDNFEFRVIPKYAEGQCEPKSSDCTEGDIDGEPAICCDGDCSPMSLGCTVGKGDNGKTCALCDGHVEAHITFDFDIDTMLNVLEDLVLDAGESVLSGSNFQVKIPYTLDGTLFFDVPSLGRAAVGFGPFEEEWKL
jgi:hypothetical protein